MTDNRHHPLPIRPQKSAERKSSLEKVLHIASKLSSALILLRDKPKKSDWFAIGLTMGEFLISLKNEFLKNKKIDSSEYFKYGFSKTSPVLTSLILECVEKPFIVGECDGNDNYICSGYIEDHQIWWRCDQVEIDRGPFIQEGTEKEFLNAFGKKAWRLIGTKNATYSSNTSSIESIDESSTFEVIKTENIEKLTKRVKSFIDAGITRSYLLVGRPGTGKSIGIVTAMDDLGLTTFRTTISAMTTDLYDWKNKSAIENIESILMMLKPDALILDDIDRLISSEGLLSAIERARKYCKVIIATANDKGNMIGAMLRAGRFDDHIEYENVNKEVVKKIVGQEEEDLIEKMTEWPIAYVKNYSDIKRVLGKESAHKEIPDIEKIIEIASKKKKKKKKENDETKN